jgi:hypothetical protein
MQVARTPRVVHRAVYWFEFLRYFLARIFSPFLALSLARLQP